MSANIIDPFKYFNVYSRGNIGDNAPYRSDFQGTTGAGGNVSFSSFTLCGLDTANPYVLHAGGNVTITGGSHTGDIEAAGDMTIGSLTIKGDVYSGGTVKNSGGGTIFGDVTAQGNILFTQNMTVYGQLSREKR